ncbi:Glycosyl transferases group 1 [Candidatus Methylopumilus universalis]
MSVLFVMDKWVAGNINFGLSAWQGNLASSLESLNIAEVEKFHFDDFHINFPHESANQALIDLCKKKCPEFIFLVISELPNKSDHIVRISTLKEIRNQLKIPIVTIFGDLQMKFQVAVLKSIEPYADLILFTALTNPGIKLANAKMKYMWVPKDPKHFHFDSQMLHCYNLSYLGSNKPNRIELVNFLKKRNVDIYTGGGERDTNISVIEYSNIIKKSKMSLSFSRTPPGMHCINARPFEIVSCNSMLLEESGIETPKLFKPFVEYIPFFSKRDCLDKIKYFIKNDRERSEISFNAYNKFNRLFTAQRFWMEVIDYIRKEEFHKINNKFSVNKSGDEFWTEPMPLRTIPKFNFLQYQDLSFLIRNLYRFLNFIWSKSYLFNIYYYTFLILWLTKRALQSPKTAPYKIYRIIMRKMHSY